MCIHTGTTVSQANHSRMYTTEIFCRLPSTDTAICSVAWFKPTRRTRLIAHRHALLIVEPLCNTLELVAPPKFSSFAPMRSEKNVAASSLLRNRSCTIYRRRRRLQCQLEVRHVQPSPELPPHLLDSPPQLKPALSPEPHRPLVLGSHARCARKAFQSPGRLTTNS